MSNLESRQSVQLENLGEERCPIKFTLDAIPVEIIMGYLFICYLVAYYGNINFAHDIRSSFIKIFISYILINSKLGSTATTHGDDIFPCSYGTSSE